MRGDVLNVIFLLLDLGIPLLLLVTAALIKRFPPRYGTAIGYRTSMAEKNELTWNTAQWLFARYCVVFMIPAAIIGAAGGIAGVVKNFDEDTCACVCAVVNTVQVIFLIIAIIFTEIGLHKRFDKNGNPK